MCVSVDIAFALCLEFVTFLLILISLSKLVPKWEHLFAVAALSDETVGVILYPFHPARRRRNVRILLFPAQPESHCYL